jgi:ubiquinone/menaquinone biosynthesis C-methylase UbiE
METFDGVSGEYGSRSVVQRKAGRKLVDLLDLEGDESILDVGCGPGHITRSLADATSGRVVGTDISGGMISQARESYPGLEFRRVAAEDLDYDGEFDVVYCNSTLQWFTNAKGALEAMHRALKPGGKIGLACPSTPEFAPWFNDIVRVVGERPEVTPTFAHWKKPWFHLPDRDAYQVFFEEVGFGTRYIALEHEVSRHTVDEAFGIYSTGAAQGFIGQAYYDVQLTQEYLTAFSEAVREEMERRARDGIVEVDFNRLYYVGFK